MADTQLQLPAGYEDAKPVQAESKVQLPAGYEDAKPVSAKSSPEDQERYNLTHPEAGKLPTVAGPSYEVRPVLPSGERVGKMQAAGKNQTYFPDLQEERNQSAEPLTGKKVAEGLWETANTPLLPEGRMEKSAHEYALEQGKLNHPYRAAAYQSVADTGKTARQLLTTPLALGTLGVGPLIEEAGGVVKAGAKLLPLAFGARGGQEAVQGLKSMKEGVTPENVQQTLEGAGQAVMGGTGALEDTRLGETPAKQVVAAPVRGAGKAYNFLTQEVPGAAGYVLGGRPGYYAAKGLAHVLPEAGEGVTEFGKTPEATNFDKLDKKAQKAEQTASKAEEEAKSYAASEEVAPGSTPKNVLKRAERTRAEADEARFHADAAKEALGKSRAPKETEQPLADTDRMRGLQGDIDRMAPRPAMPVEASTKSVRPVNVKGPGEIQPETIEQPLQELPVAPRVGQERLANNQGRMGRTLALPESPMQLPQEVLPPETEPTDTTKEQKQPTTLEGGFAPLHPDETIKPKSVAKDVEKAGDLINRGLGNEPLIPGVPLKEQSKAFGKTIRSEVPEEMTARSQEPTKTETKEPEKVSSDPRKATLQKAGATPEDIEKILARGTKNDPTSKTGLSKLAESFGVDLGQSAIGRGKGDIEAGTHMAPAEVLQKIIDAGHSPADIAKAVDEGKHLPTASGGSQGATEDLDEKLRKFNEKQTETSAKDNEHMEQAKKELGPNAFPSDYLKRAQELKDTSAKPVDVSKSADAYSDFSKTVTPKTRLASDIGEWKAPPELGAFSAEDIGKKVRAANPEPTREEVKRGAERRTTETTPEGEERRKQEARRAQDQKDKVFKQAVSELGDNASDEQLDKRIEEIKARPKTTPETAKMSQEDLLKKGFTQDDIDNGRHLPSVGGGSPAAGKKSLPSGNALIKKYGESDGDPAHTSFLLKDGRGVAQTGTLHDVMLGGKPTDNLREDFIRDQGAIRMRATGVYGDRQVSFSVPSKGISEAQYNQIMKMAPQMGTGKVYMEALGPDGVTDHKVIDVPYDKFQDTLKNSLRELVPVLNDRGAPIDEFGNPEPDEDTSFNPEQFRTQASERVGEKSKLGSATWPSSSERREKLLAARKAYSEGRSK